MANQPAHRHRRAAGPSRFAMNIDGSAMLGVLLDEIHSLVNALQRWMGKVDRGHSQLHDIVLFVGIHRPRILGTGIHHTGDPLRGKRIDIFFEGQGPYDQGIINAIPPISHTEPSPQQHIPDQRGNEDYRRLDFFKQCKPQIRGRNRPPFSKYSLSDPVRPTAKTILNQLTTLGNHEE